MCSPTQETHITSYMCSPTWETRIPCDVCSLINVMRSFSPRDCKFFFFFVSNSWSNHLFCDLHLILLPLAFNPTSLHASAKVSIRYYHVWQLLLTWIELFISIMICLPLPAPPGNTGWLLCLILRLLKIFFTTLDWRRWILAGIFNEICFTLFTWCPLASFVIIFPICFDLGDFLYPEFPTDQENNHTGSKKDTKLIRYGIFYWKFLQVFIFLNLLPEFPYKSFMLTAILRITQPHILSYWALATGGCLWSWLWLMAAKTQLWRWLFNFRV